MIPSFTVLPVDVEDKGRDAQQFKALHPYPTFPRRGGRLTHVHFSLCYLSAEVSTRSLHVIPGKTRIQFFFFLDSRFRGSDEPFLEIK